MGVGPYWLLWGVCGVFLECLWDVCGVFVVCLWGVFGVFVRRLWGVICEVFCFGWIVVGWCDVV